MYCRNLKKVIFEPRTKEAIAQSEKISIGSNVFYETFAGGYLKYSSNGIEFQKEFGLAKWNI